MTTNSVSTRNFLYAETVPHACRQHARVLLTLEASIILLLLHPVLVTEADVHATYGGVGEKLQHGLPRQHSVELSEVMQGAETRSGTDYAMISTMSGR